MKHKYTVITQLFLVLLVTLAWKVHAEDRFPDFSTSDIRIYIPIERIIHAYQPDLVNEVGFNFSYDVHGQLFLDSSEGHIQTLTEGFSGTTDKSTPWKTLTELLAAYHTADIDAVKSLYTGDTQDYINEFLSDPAVKNRFINYMNAVKGIKVLLGFNHKNGFVALVNLDYGESAEYRYSLTPFFFIQENNRYLLSRVTLNEPSLANISTYLQVIEFDIAKLPAPKHGLTVEKTGTGDGSVRGSGIDCGEDCIEVFVEGTAVWLKADADEYSTFEGWLVDGQSLSKRLVIKEDTTVTAVFEKIPPKEYTLTVETAGTGTGAVTDSETACEAEDASCLEIFSFYAGAEDAPVELVGLDCGDTCSATYTEGTTVYLHAIADEGSEFVEWQMNGEAVTEPVEISNDTTLTAVFDLVTPPEEEEEEETPGEELPDQEPEQTQP